MVLLTQCTNVTLTKTNIFFENVVASAHISVRRENGIAHKLVFPLFWCQLLSCVTSSTRTSAWPTVAHRDLKHTRGLNPRGTHQGNACFIAVCPFIPISFILQSGDWWLPDFLSQLQHRFNILCDYFRVFDFMASKGGWKGGGTWHSGGWYGNNNKSSGWKGKGSSKGYRGWQSAWNSQQSSGYWQEPPRTQWTAPPVASPPSRFSTSFASSIESAFVGAVRDQTERTTSSWVSGALDTLTSVVRRAVALPSGGQTTTAQTTDAQVPATARNSPVKPQAETTKKPELLEGDARVTRQLIDELNKGDRVFSTHQQRKGEADQRLLPWND